MHLAGAEGSNSSRSWAMQVRRALTKGVGESVGNEGRSGLDAS